MIDWARVLELREEIGIDDFEEVVALFLSEVEERLDMLSHDKPAKAFGDDLHFLKGSALNLGFTDFAQLCHEGEMSINNSVDVAATDAIIATYSQSKSIFLEKLDERAGA